MTEPNLVCRTCGAHVQWAQTEKGRRMPVNIEPVKDGNILLQHRPDRIPLAVYLTPEQIKSFEGSLQRHRLFKSHFATCPQAKSWRKKQ
jgi:hypothetical protein